MRPLTHLVNGVRPTFPPTQAEADAELERITTLDREAPGFANFEQWLSGT
ncbi:hypothetical protein [Pyxidicoccus fallax]|nr:hypothetical protein [Pyxidicoccus fallax]